MTELESHHLRQTILNLYNVDISEDWWMANLDPEKAAKIEGIIDGYGYRLKLEKENNARKADKRPQTV